MIFKREIPAWLEKWQSEFRPCVDVCKDLETEALSKQLTPEQQEGVKMMIRMYVEIDRGIHRAISDAHKRIWDELFPLEDKIIKYWHENGYYKLVTDQNGKKGVKKLDFSVALSPEYEAVRFTFDESVFFYGLASYFVVKQDGKWGIVNNQHDVLVPFEYDDIYRKPENYSEFVLVKDGKQGVAYLDGNEVTIPVPVTMDTVYYVQKWDLKLFSKDGKWGWWWHEPNKSGIFKNYSEPLYDEIFVQRWQDRNMDEKVDDYIIARKGDDLHWILYWSIDCHEVT